MITLPAPQISSFDDAQRNFQRLASYFPASGAILIDHTVDPNKLLAGADGTVLYSSAGDNDWVPFGELVDDRVSTLLVAGGGIDLTYADNGAAAGTLTIDVDASAVDHGSLAGLGDDDHTQYHTDARALAWLQARADDTDFGWGFLQTFADIVAPLIRSDAGSVNTLGSYLGRLKIDRTTTTSGSNALDITFDGAAITGSVTFERMVMPDSMTGQFTAISITGGVGKANTGVPFQMFNIAPSYDAQAVMGSGQVFWYVPSYGDDGAARTIGVGQRIFIINPVFRDLFTGSVGTPGAYNILESTPSVGDKWVSIPSIKFITMTNPARTAAAIASGNPAIAVTDLIGMDISVNITEATRVYSIRSTQPKPTLHHYGPVRLGTSTVTSRPGSILEIETNTLNDHGSLTVREEANNPPAIAAADRFRMYMKNDHLVFQFFDPIDATIKYLNTPLTGIVGPYPVAAAWVVDVVAP